jgi:rod shape-determining protein MreC
MSRCAVAVHGVGQAWSSYLDLRSVHDDNTRLADRVAGLERQIQDEQQSRPRGRALAGAPGAQAGAAGRDDRRGGGGRDGLPWFRTLTLDKGKQDGIELDAAVLSPTGIVGRVVASGRERARVQLLLDRDSGVAAMIERRPVAGVVCGQVGFADQGKPDLVMKYVSSLSDVAVGDAS